MVYNMFETGFKHEGSKWVCLQLLIIMTISQLLQAEISALSTSRANLVG